MKKSKFLDIYTRITEMLADTGQTAGVSDTAPDGAMSSGPILDKGLEDPASAIYTVFKKNCKGKECEKHFKSKIKMEEFLESNDGWMLGR
jgi:hypothetical protein